MPNFELQHLRTFVAVAKAGSVTQAAKQLYLSPPAVSAHIQRLEDELQVRLFVRTSQGMEVTEQGRILRSQAEQTLQSAQHIVQQAAALQAQLHGRVTLGVNASPQGLRLAPTIARLQADHPGIELGLVHSATGHILAALGTGALDMGYVFGPVTASDLVAHRLGAIELVVAVPQAMADQAQPVDWATLARLPWLYSDGYCPFQEIIETRFAACGLRGQSVVQTNDDATKCDLVRAGMGLALLDRAEADALVAAGAAVIREPEPLTCEVSLAYAARRAGEPLIQAVAARVCDVWAMV